MRGMWMFVAVVIGGLLGVSNTPVWAQSAPVAPAVCSVVSALQALPADVRETSGLARGRVNSDVLWTHNDSGNQPEMFALGLDGSIKARVRLNGMLFTDWEDMDSGACASGDCLYIADIGDNNGQRAHITIYEITEPRLPATEASATRAIHARYADGPQDAEAFFRTPSGEFYIVTKGRQKSIKLYRLNMAGADGHGTLQLVRELAPQPRLEADRVTAATTSADGNWVALRSYSTLSVYRLTELLDPAGAPAFTYSLLPLAEKQGESVTLDNDGTIWLTSEAEKKKDLPTLSRLSCSLK